MTIRSLEYIFKMLEREFEEKSLEYRKSMNHREKWFADNGWKEYPYEDVYRERKKEFEEVKDAFTEFTRKEWD